MAPAGLCALVDPMLFLQVVRSVQFRYRDANLKDWWVGG